MELWGTMISDFGQFKNPFPPFSFLFTYSQSIEYAGDSERNLMFRLFLLEGGAESLQNGTAAVYTTGTEFVPHVFLHLHSSPFPNDLSSHEISIIRPFQVLGRAGRAFLIKAAQSRSGVRIRESC